MSTPTNKWEESKLGSELGQILADFENDHNETKVVSNILNLIAKERQEEREGIFEEIDKIVNRARRITGGEILGEDHELVDTCELYIPLQKLKKTYER